MSKRPVQRKTVTRPQRWDNPFSPDMTDTDVEFLLDVTEIKAIQAKRFPARVSLDGILRNDTKIVPYKKGELVVREGDYGNSAFLILQGKLRVVLSPSLSAAYPGIDSKIVPTAGEHTKKFAPPLRVFW